MRKAHLRGGGFSVVIAVEVSILLATHAERLGLRTASHPAWHVQQHILNIYTRFASKQASHVQAMMKHGILSVL